MDKMKKAKKKRKMAKNLTLPHYDSNLRFLNKTFPPKIWILREIRSIELIVLKKSWLYVDKTEKAFSPIGCAMNDYKANRPFGKENRLAFCVFLSSSSTFFKCSRVNISLLFYNLFLPFILLVVVFWSQTFNRSHFIINSALNVSLDVFGLEGTETSRNNEFLTPNDHPHWNT